MLKQQIEQDLKQALLSGDKDRATTLRGLKSVILYAEVAEGIRDSGLPDDKIIALFAKEAKKRQESADFFVKGGSEERATKELAEKEIIESYLPKQLSDEGLWAIVDAAIIETEADGPGAMGKVISVVKQKVGAQADGGRVANAVKERLTRS
ncbi:MAG TPA: GatB/YqeY domain-containing protein [Candidatus Saccharimonadales bacterium]